jgi:hypothetical protein
MNERLYWKQGKGGVVELEEWIDGHCPKKNLHAD